MLLRSPSLILLLLPVGQLGCSNLLGLEELSFEEPVASQDPASSSGGAEASTGGANTGGASQATGGEPLVIPATGGTLSAPVDVDFPAEWPKGAIITAIIGQEEDSPYWLYNPDSERLHSFQSRRSEPDLLSVRVWKGGWSHVIAYETSEGRMLLGYNSTLGFVSEVVDVEGEEELLEFTPSVGTSGRSHLLNLEINGEPHILTYSQGSGSFRLFSAETRDAEELCIGTWDTGWDQIVPYRQGDVEGVLLFNFDAGVLQFEGLNPCEPDASTQFSLELSSVPTVIFAFPEAGTSSLYFYHQSGVVRNVILTDGDGGTRLGVDLDDGIWREGLSAIVPVRVDGGRYAITYDGVSGVAELKSLDEFTDDMNIVIK